MPIILLMFSSGLRVNELINIKANDYYKQENNYYISIKPKGKLNNIILPIAPETSQAINLYLENNDKTKGRHFNLNVETLEQLNELRAVLKLNLTSLNITGDLILNIILKEYFKTLANKPDNEIINHFKKEILKGVWNNGRLWNISKNKHNIKQNNY